MAPGTWSLQKALGAVVAAALLCGAAPAGPGVIETLDLSRPFATHASWRFTASQGPAIADPFGMGGDEAPGEVTLCLRKTPADPCDAALQALLRADTADVYAKPHYLNDARVVRPRPGQALLLVQTASLHGANGDQLVLTQALAYRPKTDRFAQVYAHVTGRNNNQEVRYIAAGPLQGDIVSAAPTQDAPYGFWIEVAAPTAGGPYRQVLRYRSATAYGDGNPLAVIDSEMPNIQARLGVWRPGQPLPTPAKGCAKPHLVRKALWCG